MEILEKFNIQTQKESLYIRASSNKSTATEFQTASYERTQYLAD